LAQTCPVV